MNDPRNGTSQERPFELSPEFERQLIDREIKMRERLAELGEPAPGPMCDPEEDGTCPVCGS